MVEEKYIMICQTCQEEKPCEEFLPPNKSGPPRKHIECFFCRKKRKSEKEKNYREKNLEKRREYQRKRYWEKHEEIRAYDKKWRKENKDKCTAATLRWRHKSPENMKRHTETVMAYQKKIKETAPEKFLIRKMRRHFRRIIKGIKAKKSFAYIGVSSVEEFVVILSTKTDNPNWIQDGYEVDHIWQINWINTDFSTEILEEINHIVHHHSNIRPLESSLNARRSYYDFSPLNKDDYPKFEPFLDEKTKIGLKFYWENPQLFSGQLITKGSEEELLITTHISSSGIALPSNWRKV